MAIYPGPRPLVLSLRPLTLYLRLLLLLCLLLPPERPVVAEVLLRKGHLGQGQLEYPDALGGEEQEGECREAEGPGAGGKAELRTGETVRPPGRLKEHSNEAAVAQEVERVG